MVTTRQMKKQDSANPAVWKHLGVGIDTARFGHHVTFLGEDKQPAAKPLSLSESRSGYQQLQAQLEKLHRLHPQAHIHLRIDAAGQYATNLETFLRSLNHLPMTISVGEPKRNKDYHHAHSPKRQSDATESYAMARYAVVERPEESFGKPAAFTALRRVAARVQARVTITAAPKKLKAFKHRIKEITGRSRGISMERRLTDLNRYIRGWIGYFGLARQFDEFVNLDGWIRRRIRMCYWKQWRLPRTKVRNLVRLGVNLDMAIKHAVSRKSYWRLSRTPAMRFAMPNQWLEQLGLLSLKQLWCDLAPLRGTA